MRHRQSGRQLNRNSSHRQAMFRNMAISLVEHELIKTTLIKAKELRSVAEPLITLAKEDSVANRRLAFNRTRDKATVGKLFTELGVRPATCPTLDAPAPVSASNPAAQIAPSPVMAADGPAAALYPELRRQCLPAVGVRAARGAT